MRRFATAFALSSLLWRKSIAVGPGSVRCAVPVGRLIPIVSLMVALGSVCDLHHANAQGCDPLYTFPGQAQEDRLGNGVSAAGDVNGDGYPDLIVGAPSLDGGSSPGQAHVYSGSDGSLVWTFTGMTAGDAFGYKVSGAGDVDMDGYADLIIGARLNDFTGTNAGQAYVYSGKTGALIWTFSGEAAGDHFGASVSGAEDVNHDGSDDVIIGATYNGTAGLNAGRAYVYSGRTGTLIWTFTAEAANDRFGWSVSGGGDVNRDGTPDLIVGAYGNDAGGFNNTGRAYVYSGQTGNLLLTLTGESPEDYFGVAVSGAGDINKDGFDDVVVGAQWNDAAGSDAGRAYVFYGSDFLLPVERLATTADWIMNAEGGNNEFGGSVSDAGDVNGDGFADVIVGASGAAGLRGHAYVFYGSDLVIPHVVSGAAADLKFDGEVATDEFGESVCGAGDVNRDGSDDLIVGAIWNAAGGTRAGRAYVYDCIVPPPCPPPDTVVMCRPDSLCEGTFRAGFECDKATDGDWNTSAVPDAYCDSVSVIQEHSIPLGTMSADWIFKVLRNTSCIEVRAFYWDYGTTSWTQFYEAPQNDANMTYAVPIPSGALAVSPLRTKVRVKNGGFDCGGCPLQSGEYFEGIVDWNPTCPPIVIDSLCEGIFRVGFECDKATDGDWNTSAIPDAYCDSISVIQGHSIPVGITSADWIYRVLRNTSCIEIRAFYWDYTATTWTEFDAVPQNDANTTYTVPLPLGALAVSPLRTKVQVKNGGFECGGCPLQSGEYFEGVVDWNYFDSVAAGDVNCDGAPNVQDVVRSVDIVFRGQSLGPTCQLYKRQ